MRPPIGDVFRHWGTYIGILNRDEFGKNHALLKTEERFADTICSRWWCRIHTKQVSQQIHFLGKDALQLCTVYMSILEYVGILAVNRRRLFELSFLFHGSPYLAHPQFSTKEWRASNCQERNGFEVISSRVRLLAPIIEGKMILSP